MSKVYEILNAKDVTARVARSIAEMREKSRVVSVALDAMKVRDGKPFSKHLETAVKKSLPECIVSYSSEHGMAYLSIWFPGGSADPSTNLIPYNDRVHLLLGYPDREDCYSDAKLRSDRAGTYLKYAAEADDMEKRLPEIPALVDAHNTAREAYRVAVSGFAGLGYTALEEHHR